jgi:hypothetical protein
VTEHPQHRGNLQGLPATERRHGIDRRSHLERAAALASQAIDLRALCDAEARQVTAIAKHIELLRTPTAPSVQRQIALEHLTESVEQFVTVSERIRVDLEAFRQYVRREAGLMEQRPGPSSSAV